MLLTFALVKQVQELIRWGVDVVLIGDEALAGTVPHTRIICHLSQEPHHLQSRRHHLAVHSAYTTAASPDAVVAPRCW
jgi:hypothetical protein